MAGNGKYEIEAERLYKEVYRLVFEETDWTFRYEKHDMKLYATMTPYCQKCPCYKLETTANMPPERIMDTVNPFGPYRKKYDDTLMGIEMLEEISDNTVLAYKRYQPKLFGFGLRPADSYDLMVYDRTDSFHYALHGGVNYDGYDHSFGHRTHSYPTGMLAFKTEDPNVSRLVIIWHVDVRPPKIVPAIIVDKLSCSSVLKNIECLKAMAKEPYERLTSEIPFCRHRKP